MRIIISGASKGIGYATALEVANGGHEVLALARNKELLNELSSNNKKISILSIDLTAPDVQQTLQASNWIKEGVDGIVNNAGQLINRPFLETTAEVFREQYDANVISAINLIQACISFLNKDCHIVNVSSMGGFQGSAKFPGLSAYSASKAALSVLTECLAEELKENQVIVNALALGAVQTEMLQQAFPAYQAPTSPEEMGRFISDFVLKQGAFFNGKILPVALGNP